MKLSKGLSLIELLISIVIFGIISTAIMLTMTSSFRTATVSRNINEMTQSINNAFEIIQRDLELAGNHVMDGIYIPGNTPSMIIRGFDNTGSLNNIPSDIDILNMNGDRIGWTPAGTDTIAFTFTQSAGDFDLRCSSISTFIKSTETTALYSQGSASALTVDNADDFQCYMDENSQDHVFALIINQIMSNSDLKYSELFTIEDISGNNINIADDGFSNGDLNNDFNEGSRVYLLGSSPNAGKIEYFILEWDEVNPRDPNTPLRSLVKRINNREVYPIADNIIDMQIRYITDDGKILSQITDEIIGAVEIEITIRSNDIISDNYIEQTYSSLISVKGTMYRETDGDRYYP